MVERRRNGGGELKEQDILITETMEKSEAKAGMKFSLSIKAYRDITKDFKVSFGKRRQMNGRERIHRI